MVHIATSHEIYTKGEGTVIRFRSCHALDLRFYYVYF